jgi:hypothetical protein
MFSIILKTMLSLFSCLRSSDSRHLLLSLMLVNSHAVHVFQHTIVLRHGIAELFSVFLLVEINVLPQEVHRLEVPLIERPHYCRHVHPLDVWRMRPYASPLLIPFDWKT